MANAGRFSLISVCSQMLKQVFESRALVLLFLLLFLNFIYEQRIVFRLKSELFIFLNV